MNKLRNFLPLNIKSVDIYRYVADSIEAFVSNKLIEQKISQLTDRLNIDRLDEQQIRDWVQYMGYPLQELEGYTSSLPYLKKVIQTLSKRILSKTTYKAYEYIDYLYNLQGQVFPLIVDQPLEESGAILTKWSNWLDYKGLKIEKLHLDEVYPEHHHTIDGGKPHIPLPLFADMDLLADTSLFADDYSVNGLHGIYFHGDGLTQSFQIEFTPINEYAMEVYVEGQKLFPLSDYTVTPNSEGSLLIINMGDYRTPFSGAPPVGINNILIVDLTNYLNPTQPDTYIPWTLDNNNLFGALTRHFVYSFFYKFIENEREMMSRNTVIALHRDVVWSKRNVEVPHYEIHLKLRVTNDQQEFSDPLYSEQNLTTPIAFQRSIAPTPIVFSNCKYIRFGKGGHPNLSTSIITNTPPWPGPGDFPSFVQKPLQDFFIGGIDPVFEIKYQSLNRFDIQNRILHDTKFIGGRKPGIELNNTFEISELALLDITKQFCYFYITFPKIIVTGEMLNSLSLSFQIET